MVHVLAILALCFLSHCFADESDGEMATRLHNEYRRLQGASNMKMMIWDQEIADQAAAYVSRCIFEHDNNRGNVGENLYARTSASENLVQKGIDAWYNEIDDYVLSTFDCRSGKVCGHFTQVVWADSYRLGCAAAECPSGIQGTSFRSGFIYMCRYGPPGNVRGRNPFERGDECSDCEGEWGNCVDGLCAMDDMLPATSTTEEPITPSTTLTSRTTTIASSTTRSTTSSSTSRTSRPAATSTIFWSSSPGTEPTEEPLWPTEHPNDCEEGCSCSKYKRALEDYEEKMRDWKQKYEMWKEKYDICE